MIRSEFWGKTGQGDPAGGRHHDIGDFMYDNVTASGQLRDSRGVSHKILHGTHMVVCAAKPHAETKFDHLQLRNMFDKHQILMSPMRMRMCEAIYLHATELGTVAFINHKATPVGEQPDDSREGTHACEWLTLCQHS